MSTNNNPDGGLSQAASVRPAYYNNAGLFSRVGQFYTAMVVDSGGGLAIPNPLISIYGKSTTNNPVDKTYVTSFKPNQRGSTSSDLVTKSLTTNGQQFFTRATFDRKRENVPLKRPSASGLIKPFSWRF